MIDCEETIVLLGPFEDGELAPHEMQEVARHLAGCAACEAALQDYRSIGLLLREGAAEPVLDGFAEAVQARIARIRIPLHTRVAGYFDRFGERFGAAVGVAMVAAVAAVVTIALVMPYARNLASQNSPPVSAVIAQGHQATAPAMAVASNNNRAGQPGSAMIAPASEDTPGALADDVASDSKAIISRLETDSPSVAVWSEPRTDTTVIWVPDQQP
ncbi:MAG: anti-sigma factor family protein [Candidatus Binataceae bacterium]